MSHLSDLDEEYSTYRQRVSESTRDGGTGVETGGPSDSSHPISSAESAENPRVSANTKQTVLLDRDLHNSPSSSSSRLAWSAKSRRAFHRILSGIRRSEHYGGTWVNKRLKLRNYYRNVVCLTNCKHLVLTGAPNSNQNQLNRHFETLRKRWIRKWGKFDYCKIKTSEGNGVLHVLIRTTRFIPQNWLSQQWSDIHGAFVVFIKELYSDSRRAAGYLASQYCSGQSFLRLSCSRNWLGRKAIWNWKHICFKHRGNFKAILSAWDRWLAQSVTIDSPLSIEAGT